jgi:3-oxoacyl-[acyl-carrier protein] reductase
VTASYPSLQGKVAVVTGSNHGIGAATAKALAAQGCAVLMQYLRMQPINDGARDAYHVARAQSADAVVEGIRKVGGRAEPVECDLSQTGSITKLFDECAGEQRCALAG